MNTKTKRGLCATPYCRNRRRENRSDCHTCKSRKHRAAHPEKFAFRSLKAHAKERGIEFAITFEQFMEVALKSDYIEKKGNHAQGLTVDRINNLKGYILNNVCVMTRSENSVKRAKFDAIRMKAGYSWQN